MKKGKVMQISVVFLLIIILIFTFFNYLFLTGDSIDDSDSSGYLEWKMVGRYFNHTSWDGEDFPTITGLNYVSYIAGNTIHSSPAVANGYVYIGSDDYNIYQLNASNVSQEIARYATGNSVWSSPAVANGYVYIGSYDGNIYQLNASNVSQLIANYTIGSFLESSPAVANGYVYIGSDDYNIYQLNASNVSQLIANYTLGNAIYSSPAVANRYVYIGSYDYNIYQLNASNVSQLIANYTLGNAIYSSPAIANGYLYVGSHDNNIYQLNASNVSQEITHYSAGSVVASSPAIANGYLYVGSHDNNIYQLNASNVSQLIANYLTGDDIWSSPAIANGYLYVGSHDNNIYQLNASNVSQLIANYATGNDVYSSPAVANGYVYIGSVDNNIYQLNASNISFTTNYFLSPELNVSNVTIIVGSSFGVWFNASDNFGISTWYLNDTTNFKINQSGYFENKISLSAGYYSVSVSVNNSYGYETSEIVLVQVNVVVSEETITPSQQGGGGSLLFQASEPVVEGPVIIQEALEEDFWEETIEILEDVWNSVEDVVGQVSESEAVLAEQELLAVLEEGQEVVIEEIVVKQLNESLGKGERINLFVKDELVYVGIANVSNDSVVVQVNFDSSVSQRSISVGSSQSFDLNEDGLNDLRVSVEYIDVEQKAAIMVEVVYPGIAIVNETFEEELQAKERVRQFLGFIAIVMVLLVVVFLVLRFRKFKK
jgi:outer membrane protein assembly factor BamB